MSGDRLHYHNKPAPNRSKKAGMQDMMILLAASRANGQDSGHKQVAVDVLGTEGAFALKERPGARHVVRPHCR